MAIKNFGKVVFRRIRGRLVPIRMSGTAKNLAVGGAAFLGATAAAHKIRKTTAESIKGKGKKSFGGLSNVVFEIGTSAAILAGLAKFGPQRARAGIPAFGRIIAGSFGAARRQGRGR